MIFGPIFKLFIIFMLFLEILVSHFEILLFNFNTVFKIQLCFCFFLLFFKIHLIFCSFCCFFFFQNTRCAIVRPPPFLFAKCNFLCFFVFSYYFLDFRFKTAKKKVKKRKKTQKTCKVLSFSDFSVFRLTQKNVIFRKIPFR